MMQSSNWAPEHSDALREYLAKGLSYAEIADAINAQYKTTYSRNAAIGRARRMGFAGPDRPKPPPKAKAPRLHKMRVRCAAESRGPMPMFESVANVKLRCVGIVPRHLSLLELERGECRYPYGGDAEGEAITFCGHPRRRGSSYCAAHFELSIGPGTESERAADRIPSRLLEVA
jgi:GcrA cell cycle regulator